MEVLIKLASNIKNINLQIVGEIVLKKNEAEILDANIEQLSRGEDADGAKFPEYANEDYFNTKRGEGLIEKAGNHYNFLLEGDFRKGFMAKYQNDNMIIDSTDSKREKLVELVSGWEIFGIQDKNIEKLDLADDYSEEILKQMMNGI